MRTALRRVGMLTSLVLAAATLQVPALAAQHESGGEDDARSRELAQRMRMTLERQARDLSRLQREIERAAKADPRVRDSIVRTTSHRIAELAAEIARVQMEADRVQVQLSSDEARGQLRVQIASARAIADVMRSIAGKQRELTFMTRSAPRGYLGVTLSGEQRTELREGKVFTVFESPTLIESVIPDSPAARSGLSAGDTITAFGRLAVPGAVPLADVLTPGERLTMKVRRSGRERQVTVTVGATQPGSTSMASSDGGIRLCFGEGCPAAPPQPGRVPAPERPSAAAAPAPPAPPSWFGTWTSNDFSIAGAVMTSITDELEELTGVDEGILVLRVAPGTPAATSGLRGGDVILRVNDEDCEGVRDLQIAVQRASSRGGRTVQLAVSRQHRERAITLRW
ncbi:MAG: PDZ domain-containing protein [Gemmatimonadaceae bacterium]|nr:PDZ domain-containing protein [Gemmatimonadaceae bacterium]